MQKEKTQVTLSPVFPSPSWPWLSHSVQQLSCHSLQFLPDWTTLFQDHSMLFHSLLFRSFCSAPFLSDCIIVLLLCLVNQSLEQGFFCELCVYLRHLKKGTYKKQKNPVRFSWLFVCGNCCFSIGFSAPGNRKSQAVRVILYALYDHVWLATFCPVLLSGHTHKSTKHRKTDRLSGDFDRDPAAVFMTVSACFRVFFW